MQCMCARVFVRVCVCIYISRTSHMVLTRFVQAGGEESIPIGSYGVCRNHAAALGQQDRRDATRGSS